MNVAVMNSVAAQRGEKRLRCPECGCEFPQVEPVKCRCGATLLASFSDDGELVFLLARRFFTGMKPGLGVNGAHRWLMLYEPRSHRTLFKRAGELHLLPGYVSHRRFAKLLPFL